MQPPKSTHKVLFAPAQIIETINVQEFQAQVNEEREGVRYSSALMFMRALQAHEEEEKKQYEARFFEADHSARHSEPVVLNIYHVTTANRFLEFLGFGLYHTSVAVYGIEYSYGGHEEQLPGTVIDYKGNSAGLVLKESLPVGQTYYLRQEVTSIVERYGSFWYGCDYDPFSKNCNHFTEHLIRTLCDKHEYYYPSYVNRFTKLGSILRMWFKPLQDIVGNIVNYEESGSDKDSKD